MPGNELGDRVHNFFAADNTLQGQRQSQVVDGNWPVLNNNFWAGSQRQIDVLSSSAKSFHPQNSDFDRGQGSYPFNAANGLNFSESNLRSDFLKIQSPKEQPKLNGCMHETQFHQSKQNDGNFLAVDTDSDRCHQISSMGLSVHEAQMGEHPAKALARPETSIPSVSFDLFGGQRQMSHQQSSMQSFQRQPSGLNDMQQQQLMIGKMQELQRQQQLRHLDLRRQNFIYQASPISKQAAGSQSTGVSGTPGSEALQYSWPAELGTNWLNHGSSTLQGSPNGLVFQSSLGQSQLGADLVPRQVDQSLYGVPVSSSRGLSVNQYSQMETNRFPMPEMSTSSKYSQANRQNLLPDQVGDEDGTSIGRQKFQSEIMLGHATIQSLNTGIVNLGGSQQQLSSMQRNAPQQNFPESQDLSVQTEISAKKTRQVASPPNEISLDPTEEKILFGSDNDIWAGFGKIPRTSGGSGNLFDNGGPLNELPSIQSGSWSALMQSAVAETSSADVGPQEGWNGLTFHSIDGPANQPSLMHTDHGNQETTLGNDNMQMHSPLRSRSIPPSDDTNNINVMELNQYGHNLQNEPGRRLQTEMSQSFVQSMEEAGKWSNHDPAQKSAAEGSQVYRNASQHYLEAEGHATTISTPWAPGRCGTREQQNALNVLEALPPGGDRVLNVSKAEKMSQNSQNNQFRAFQGDLIRESSLRKSNSVSTSAAESGPVKPKVGNAQVNERIVSWNNDASAANSSYSGVGDEISPFVQNNFLRNQWKIVNPSTKSEGGESLGRRLHQVNEHNQVSLNSSGKGGITMHETDSCDLKENSIDCHSFNLSNHTSVGFRESGLSDSSNSRSLASGKQKSTNQLSRKVTVPRKFQYHPMGNFEEDVEPAYGMKQPIKLQVMPQQSTHFGASKIDNPPPRDSMVMEKGQLPEVQRANKGPDEEPSHSSFLVHLPSVPVPIPFSRPFDSYIPNKASSSSQNMLELLHKVDQSRDYGAMMHLGSSECNTSSQRPEAEKTDRSLGHLQRSQSSASQGFGLQLGPPSEWLQIPDHSLSSQNAQGTVNLLHASHAAAEMVEKGHQMVPGSSVQYLPFPNGESQIVLKNNKSAVLEHAGNENFLNKMPLNFHSAFSSGTPYARSHLQNQQIERGSEKLSMKKHIDSSLHRNASTERGSAETIMSDTSANIQKDNLALSWGAAPQTGPDDISERDPMVTASTSDLVLSSQHFGMPGVSPQEASAQMLHDKWTNVSTDQLTMGQRSQVWSQPNIMESSSVPQTQVDLGVSKEGYLSSELSTFHVSSAVDGEEQRLTESSGQPLSSAIIDPVPEMKESLETASLVKNHHDDSPSTSGSVQKDIEAFGRTLKPTRFSSQNYSLINQMRTLKDAETDPSNRASKKMKGPDNILDAHEVPLMAGQQDKNNVFIGDSLGLSAGVLSENSMMLRFSKLADNLQRDTFQHGNEASENVPQRNSCSDRFDHSQVIPQMAPSWFNQYGAFKKGEILSMHNASKVSPLMPGEPPFTHEKPSSGLDTCNAEKGTFAPTDSCQIGSTHQGSIPSLVENDHLSSPLSLQLNVTDQHLVNLKMKKRKSTSELHPWHKEILDDSQKFWTLSMAEAEWSEVTNRLKEKVENDAEVTEDGSPLLRSRRRIVLTTQLMQQLFCSPPAAILSVDASSCFEDVAYAASRIALGDACCTVSHSSDLDMAGDNVHQLSAKGKPSDRNHYKSFARYVGEIMGRTSKLENDFVRLDKAASLLDLRLECQDLEKFSVINRFAKFHGRRQNDNNADTASINGEASTLTPCPQRYVSAVPVPRILPDRVQCLSL